MASASTSPPFFPWIRSGPWPHRWRPAPEQSCRSSPVELLTPAAIPVPLMASAVEILAEYPTLELLWASPREILNVSQAESVGCHIITVTPDLLEKLSGLGRSLEEVSLDTVRMFHRDAAASGYLL